MARPKKMPRGPFYDGPTGPYNREKFWGENCSEIVDNKTYGAILMTRIREVWRLIGRNKACVDMEKH